MLNNAQAAARLALLGDLVELVENQPFKARAFHNAARSLKGLQEPFTELLRRDQLGELPGFGKAVVAKLGEFADTGSITELDELTAKVPAGVLLMRRVQGLGAKKLRTLYLDHDITTLDALEAAARDGTLEGISGFGAKSVAKILDGIGQVRSFHGYMRMPRSRTLAGELEALVCETLPGAEVTRTGELRRHLEIVGNVELIVSRPLTPDLADRVQQGVSGCEAAEFTDASCIELRFDDGATGALIYAAPDALAITLLETTGPQDYVDFVRERGGVAGATEAAICEQAGLPYLPASARDVESQWTSGVPDELVRWEDLRGVLHCHTNYSDGLVDLRQMAEAARTRGLEYIGICDHSQTSGYAGGLKPDRVKAQHAEIDRLNAEYDGSFRIFKGIESDILPDGSLDYEPDLLARFDFIVASVHSGLDMDEATATERVCRALANPYTTMLGHATGRLLLQRCGYPLDWERVIDTAVAHDVVIEHNANPRRLDIDWRWLPRLYAAGGRTAINPDAHIPDGIDDMRYGIDVVRKVGTVAEQVLNTLKVDDLARYFEARKEKIA